MLRPFRISGLVMALALLGARGAGAQRVSPTDVDCITCHPNVHATMVGAGEKTAVRCRTCHAQAHAPVDQLYTGVGTDSTVLPDKMYLARVACGECHTGAERGAAAGAPRTAALTRACTSCHGARFEQMLPRWSAAMTAHTQAADAYVASAAADPRLAAQPGARARVAAARASVSLVTAGNGLHNVPGADALLRTAVRTVGDAYRAAGLPVPAAPALGPDPAIEACAYCHYGIETVRGTVAGRSFDHADHVLRAGVACTQCHSAANYFTGTAGQVDPRHGHTTVSAASCNDCHHVKSTLACTTCHQPGALAAHADSATLSLRLTPAGAPASRRVAFRHDAHAAVACASCHTDRSGVRNVAACTTCHEAHHEQAADCTACHGTSVRSFHTAANHLACTQCHARQTVQLLTGNRTFCLSCHVDRRDHHPAQECAPCHMQMSPAEVQARILGGRR